MSALYTALVEGETKHSLAQMVCELRSALREMVYETTHLSPVENDGSHWCKISGATLLKAREALGDPLSNPQRQGEGNG